MSSYFGIALLLYLAFLIANVVLGGSFIERLRKNHTAMWEKLGKPVSVFSARKRSVDLYKYLAFATEDSFKGDTAMFWLTKALLVVTIATQSMFLVAVAAFVVG